MDLNNSHIPKPPIPKYNKSDAEKIWKGVDELVLQQRLKLVYAVRDELKRLDPCGAVRITSNRGYKGLRLTSNEIIEYMRLDSSYPGLVPNDPKKDPGDPWLVVYALVHGWTVVTSELPAARSLRRVSGVKIPDVCLAESVPCISLDELIRSEQLL